MVGLDALAVWCRRWLGVPPAAQLFEAGYLSAVRGLRLGHGREVVVKVRPGEPPPDSELAVLSAAARGRQDQTDRAA